MARWPAHGGEVNVVHLLVEFDVLAKRRGFCMIYAIYSFHCPKDS